MSGCPFLKEQQQQQSGCPFLTEQQQQQQQQQQSGCPFLAEQQQQQQRDTQRQHSTQTHESSEDHPATISTSASASSMDSAELVQEQPPAQPSWLMKRPKVDGQEHLRRQQLRKLNRKWTMEEVAAHKFVDDLWVVVDGRVFDITEHLVNHDGWGTAAVSTPLSILAAGGTDCSQDFHDIHRLYPIAYKQLNAFYIGDLDTTTQS